MKNKIVACLVMAAFMVFNTSCNDTEGAFNKPLPETKGKEPRTVKPKKKKEKTKPVQANKRKAEPVDEKDPSNETATASPFNATLGNIIIKQINSYVVQNGFSMEYCFLIDMSLPSGRNRFFVYDIEKNSVVYSGLVAHGCCNESFIAHPRFSNNSGSGCSSLGKYKVGAFYRGQWGKSYRLYGLDKSNSNAYQRAVVIHGHGCVEDKEIYPRVLCNSFGCPMVSYKFFDKLSRIIEHSEKPILLWIYR